MNFDFILECETSDEKRKKQYEEIYRLIDEAEHIYWVDKSGCAELLCKAAEQICFRGTQTASKLFPDFPICIDGKFYFAGTSTKPKSSKSKTPCGG